MKPFFLIRIPLEKGFNLIGGIAGHHWAIIIDDTVYEISTNGKERKDMLYKSISYAEWCKKYKKETVAVSKKRILAETSKSHEEIEAFGYKWMQDRPDYHLIGGNNCQDFCVALAKFLKPGISYSVFPLCEAAVVGDDDDTVEDHIGYASAISGEGMARAKAGVADCQVSLGVLGNYKVNAFNIEGSAQAADNVLGAQAEAAAIRVRGQVTPLLSYEMGVMGRVGASVGAVNSLDLGIVGGEIGKNGIRFSCPLFSIRLFGSE